MFEFGRVFTSDASTLLANHRCIHRRPQEYLGHKGVQGKALCAIVNFSIEEHEVDLLMREGVCKKILLALRRAEFALDREVSVRLSEGFMALAVWRGE